MLDTRNYDTESKDNHNALYMYFSCFRLLLQIKLDSSYYEDPAQDLKAQGFIRWIRIIINASPK